VPSSILDCWAVWIVIVAVSVAVDVVVVT